MHELVRMRCTVKVVKGDRLIPIRRSALTLRPAYALLKAPLLQITDRNRSDLDRLICLRWHVDMTPFALCPAVDAEPQLHRHCGRQHHRRNRMVRFLQKWNYVRFATALQLHDYMREVRKGVGGQRDDPLSPRLDRLSVEQLRTTCTLRIRCARCHVDGGVTAEPTSECFAESRSLQYREEMRSICANYRRQLATRTIAHLLTSGNRGCTEISPVDAGRQLPTNTLRFLRSGAWGTSRGL
ncbi:hypothetical protein EK21DRAFT_90507 [Setomelanomma holmii]|uniref:Uncharacterized protein n=1 Tax=Setomelanomma holmii TaxID=210430 RepID=A0A9P4H7L9_9PLEO|nr:hypothetical protein EK21DRAFT_90507 [Setomelanomma holmii]